MTLLHPSLNILSENYFMKSMTTMLAHVHHHFRQRLIFQVPRITNISLQTTATPGFTQMVMVGYPCPTMTATQPIPSTVQPAPQRVTNCERNMLSFAPLESKNFVPGSRIEPAMRRHEQHGKPKTDAERSRVDGSTHGS